MTSKPTIGILGAGKLGTSLGRLAVEAGYPVLIAGSQEAEKIALIVEILVPNAQPKTNTEVVNDADIIVLALPLSKMKTIPKENLGDKIIIDAMNYWWEVDGEKRIPSDPNLSSTELVATVLNSKHLVKAFNHMGYHDLEFETFSNKPKVIAMASDNPKDKEIVGQIISDLGFVPLDLGPLKNGNVLEPGSALFGANLELKEFLEVLEDAKNQDS